MSETGQLSRKIPPDAPAIETKAGDQETSESALAETELLSKGLSIEELEEQSVRSEHERTEKFKWHFEIIAILAMWTISAAIALFGITWLWHTLTPERWHWLTSDQTEKIQNIVAGVVLAGILGDHVRKRLK